MTKKDLAREICLMRKGMLFVNGTNCKDSQEYIKTFICADAEIIFGKINPKKDYILSLNDELPSLKSDAVVRYYNGIKFAYLYKVD